MAKREVVIQKVRDFSRILSRKGIRLHKVILFGSYARGEHRRYSDVDVALVSDDFSGVAHEDTPLLYPALRKHYTIQPQTYHTQDLKQGDPFLLEILRTGIEINLERAWGEKS